MLNNLRADIYFFEIVQRSETSLGTKELKGGTRCVANERLNRVPKGRLNLNKNHYMLLQFHDIFIISMSFFFIYLPN